MAPLSKKRVRSLAKKKASKKGKTPKASLLTKNQEQESEEGSSKKKPLASLDPPIRKLFDHRFVKQDAFFTRAQKLKLEVIRDVAHTFAEPDSMDDAFAIPPEDTSKFRLMRQDYTAVPILFRCPIRPSSEWKLWVSSEMENVGAKDKLRSAGILAALMSSTKLGMYRDIRGLRHLVRRWNKTTHTFICSWGEFTPTLDDVSKLLELPVLGDLSPFSIELSGNEAKIEAKLVEGLSLCRQLENNRQSSRPSYACWIRYFWGTMKNNKFYPGTEYGNGCGLAALVSLWLSRFVFPELQGDIVQRRMFPLAIKLASGVRFPLAPVFLGTLYKHLDTIVEDEVLAAGTYAIDTELAINFLQVFLWERINKYAGEKPPHGKSPIYEAGMSPEMPLWSRWFHMKRTKPSIWFYIDNIDNFTFRPYVGLSNEFPSSKHGDAASSTWDIVKVPMCDSDGNWADLDYVLSMRPGLLPAWIGSEIHSMNYWPHRVLRQFGLDQGVPRTISFSDEDILDSPSFGMSRFISSSLKSLPKIKSLMIQIACDGRESLYTPKFVTYWEKMISEFNKFTKSPRSVCKAQPPTLVPKRLRLDTREVRSLSIKIGMPFTVIDETHQEIVGEVRNSRKADEIEENLPLNEAFPKTSMFEDPDNFSLIQKTCDIPLKKRVLSEPNSANPKRKSARLSKKYMPSQDIATEKNEETGHASAEPNGDASNAVETRIEEANNKVRSEESNVLEMEIAVLLPQDNQEKTDTPWALVSHQNSSTPDQSQTPSRSPRENSDNEEPKRSHDSPTLTTVDANSGDNSSGQSTLDQFLGAFDGTTVAPQSIEDFIQLSGQTELLRGIAIPAESFRYMTDALERHGDFTANCWASRPVKDVIFSRLSLVFYTLAQTLLQDLSEDALLALRDVVREATAVGFGVEFLFEHLRKIVYALFGRRIYFDKLENLESRIGDAQREYDEARARLEELNSSRAEIESKASVSTGTEGDCIRQALELSSSLAHGL